MSKWDIEVTKKQFKNLCDSLKQTKDLNVAYTIQMGSINNIETLLDQATPKELINQGNIINPKCSKCNYSRNMRYDYNYCPNCGQKIK